MPWWGGDDYELSVAALLAADSAEVKYGRVRIGAVHHNTLKEIQRLVERRGPWPRELVELDSRFCTVLYWRQQRPLCIVF